MIVVLASQFPMYHLSVLELVLNSVLCMQMVVVVSLTLFPTFCFLTPDQQPNR